MLNKLFKKDFTHENFILELLFPTPKEKWLEEALASGSIDINHKDENDNTFLMTLLKKGHYKYAIWLIEHGANPTIKNNENLNPIDIAIQKDKVEIVETLLKLKKLDVNQRDEYGRSLLQNMVVSGNHKMARILIEGGANINNLDNKGKDIIYDALSYGEHGFVRELLTYDGIELNHIDNDGNTIMQHPQIEQDDTLARDLLIAGSDPTILNAKGESYLYKTALRGEEAKNIIEVALEHGANVNARTTTNNSIMMEIFLRASEAEKNKKYQKDLLDIVSHMLKYGGDVNALDAKGESGLFNVIRMRNIPLIKYLLKANIDVNIQNKRGETVLEKLVYTGMDHSAIIKLLLQHGIDPTLKNKDGKCVYEILTNLILHQEKQLLLEDEEALSLFDQDALYMNTVQLLLENEKIKEGKHFILEVYDSIGDPLFFKPLMYDNFALFNLFIKAKVNIHQLNKQHYNIFFAYVVKIFEDNKDSPKVCKNFQDNISSLISRRVDKDFKDQLGWTILHKVVSTECNIKLFKILTDVVPFDYYISDNLGRTVIHCAVWHDNYEVIKIVNTISPDLINIEDKYRITPIYYAALLGNRSLVSHFFDLGASVTTSGKIDAKALKKFKPMLKNLPKLTKNVSDLALKHRMESLIEEITSKFTIK
ncbi:MAG: hypothetical protein CSA86_01180 [Arcobacter sp.]|nr:MAG: hypothetical protein CSA86_01180 [Arcobacter sp.]